MTELPGEDVASPSARPGPWAWGICWLMFASTVLNYMDRQAIALVAPQIKGEYRLDDEQFGWVLAAFFMTYALFQVPAGYLVDRWDVRWTYAGAVGFWSLAGMAAAFSPNLATLIVLRALLGIGESFNWPCALRVTAAILPPKDRSLGNGIFNSGAAVGAVLTPVLVTLLTARYGWRTAFFTVGMLGFVWVAVWLTLMGGARRHSLAGDPPKRGFRVHSCTVGSWKTTRSIGRECTAGDRRSRPVLTAKRLDHPDPTAPHGRADRIGWPRASRACRVSDTRPARDWRPPPTPRRLERMICSRDQDRRRRRRCGRRGLTARRPTPRRRYWRGPTRSHPEHGR